ncbi:hypothetical protein ABZ135_22850 [Streptomyces sp. NPDC006339]|uniref:hypothetical protein n=1 Tax=Streptomyces sp. NPDC006339 TaxID=3156755 RepID=UPI0033A6A705
MKLIHRVIALGAVAAAFIGGGVVTVASAAETGTSSASVAGELPPLAVENFAYPDAARIQSELGLVVKSGDGHIMLADCSSATGLLEVYSRTKGKICFTTTGTNGRLVLEIPTVYGMKGSSSHQTTVTLTAENSEQSITAARDEWKAVGESADPERRDHVLVGIVTSP